jgi:hypothetical protein
MSYHLPINFDIKVTQPHRLDITAHDRLKPLDQYALCLLVDDEGVPKHQAELILHEVMPSAYALLKRLDLVPVLLYDEEEGFHLHLPEDVVHVVNDVVADALEVVLECFHILELLCQHPPHLLVIGGSVLETAPHEPSD